MRECPVCGAEGLSITRLAVLHRATCRSCGSRVGFNWLFAAFLYTAVVATFSIAMLFVVTEYGIIVGAGAFVLGLTLLSGAAARFGPLEEKLKWWQL